MKGILAATLGALGLSGCFDESANLGAAPPVLLATSRVVVAAPPLSSRIGRDRLRWAARAVAEGQLQSVRAQIRMRRPQDGETIRRELVGLGMDPARLLLKPLLPGEPGPSEVIFTRQAAGTIPCAAAIQPDYPDDPLPSLMSLARCNQANNLAQMLVDPADLTAPPRLSAQDGAYLVDGIRSWRADRTGRLPSQSTTIGAGDSGSGTAAPGPSTVAPATNTIEPGQTSVTR